MKKKLIFFTAIFIISTSIIVNSCRENSSEAINQTQKAPFRISKTSDKKMYNLVDNFLLKKKHNKNTNSRLSELSFDNFNNDDLSMITYEDGTNALVAREIDFSNENDSNYAVCYLINNDTNTIDDAFFLNESARENDIKNVEYYDADGNLQLHCQYNYITGYLTMYNVASSTTSRIRINWTGVKSCVNGIYNLDTGTGWGLAVISAFVPETYAAVVAGCILKNS